MNLTGIGMTSQRTRDRLVARLKEQGITNSRVLEVMRSTPRHIFLDEALSHRAYEDAALPIGYSQTLSQPYTVARMTELLLENGTPNRVLEIGTGSGYQTTVLAQLVPTVFSVERIKPLQDKARERFRLLQLRNIQLKHADGGFGWSERGPFDAIISTAAPSAVPEELKEQLAEGGRLVIPIGDDRGQQLYIIDRHAEGFTQKVVEPAKFVPLQSGLVR